MGKQRAHKKRAIAMQREIARHGITMSRLTASMPSVWRLRPFVFAARARDAVSRWRLTWNAKDLFRRLSSSLTDAARWCDRHALELALVAVIFALVVFLGMATWLNMRSPDMRAMQREYAAYLEKLEVESGTDAGERAWQRLHRKHGFPGAVVYKPGGMPYYINKDGQKCRFM